MTYRYRFILRAPRYLRRHAAVPRAPDAVPEHAELLDRLRKRLCRLAGLAGRSTLSPRLDLSYPSRTLNP